MMFTRTKQNTTKHNHIPHTQAHINPLCSLMLVKLWVPDLHYRLQPGQWWVTFYQIVLTQKDFHLCLKNCWSSVSSHWSKNWLCISPTFSTLLLRLTFLQCILHDGSPPRQLLAAGWPEERFALAADLLTARTLALPHPSEKLHLLLQQRHDLSILPPQQICSAKHRNIFVSLDPSLCSPANSLNMSFSPLISFAFVSSCLLSSSVSLGIPSSSSLSLPNQAKEKKKYR